MTGTAWFSEDRRYRWSLTRDLALPLLLESGPTVLICGCNPSTADADKNDPTIAKEIGFVTRILGATRLIKVNLLAAVATNPRDLARIQDPIGPRNDWAISDGVLRADVCIAAWGIPKGGAAVARIFEKRAREVIALPTDWQCFGVTDGGYPKHPLYLPSSTKLVPLREASA